MRRVRKVKKMAQKQKKYEKEYKVQAVKLAKEIGAGKAAKELGIPVDTLYGGKKAIWEGRLEAGLGSRPPRQRNEPCGGTDGAAQGSLRWSERFGG